MRKKLTEEGYKILKDKKEAFCFFEHYGCSRFTTLDGNSKIILDICHYVK